MDKLVSSNNESDDSLASDIGLDHMMCQRLFGSKGILIYLWAQCCLSYCDHLAVTGSDAGEMIFSAPSLKQKEKKMFHIGK